MTMRLAIKKSKPDPAYEKRVGQAVETEHVQDLLPKGASRKDKVKLAVKIRDRHRKESKTYYKDLMEHVEDASTSEIEAKAKTILGKAHKYKERAGTPGHYQYKYDDTQQHVGAFQIDPAKMRDNPMPKEFKEHLKKKYGKAAVDSAEYKSWVYKHWRLEKSYPSHDDKGLSPAYVGHVIPGKAVWAMTRDEFVSERRYKKALHSTYFDDKEQRLVPSSRTTPQNESLYDFPLGVWMLEDDTKHDRFKPSPHGTRVFQLREVAFEHLKFTEDKVAKNEGSRGDDAQRYAQWIRDGLMPPPIKCFEDPADGTIKIFDGHRRATACHLARVPIRAWVNPVMTITEGYDKKKVEATVQLIVQEALQTNEPVPDAVVIDFLEGGNAEMQKARAVCFKGDNICYDDGMRWVIRDKRTGGIRQQILKSDSPDLDITLVSARGWRRMWDGGDKALWPRLAVLAKGRGFHKYIKRLGVKGNYKYFYKQEQEHRRLGQAHKDEMAQQIMDMAEKAPEGTFRNWNGVIWRMRANGKWRQARKAEREEYWALHGGDPGIVPEPRVKRVREHEPTKERKLMISQKTFKAGLEKVIEQKQEDFTKEELFVAAFGRDMRGAQDEERLQTLIQGMGYANFDSMRLVWGLQSYTDRVGKIVYDHAPFVPGHDQSIAQRMITGEIEYEKWVRHDNGNSVKVTADERRQAKELLLEEGGLIDIMTHAMSPIRTAVNDIINQAKKNEERERKQNPARYQSHLGTEGWVRQVQDIPRDKELVDLGIAHAEKKECQKFLTTQGINKQQGDIFEHCTTVCAQDVTEATYKIYKEIGFRGVYMSSYKNTRKVTSFARANGVVLEIGERMTTRKRTYEELVHSRQSTHATVQMIRTKLTKKLNSLNATERVEREQELASYLSQLTVKEGKNFYGNYIHEDDPIGSVVAHEIGHVILYQLNEPQHWKTFWRKAKKTGMMHAVSGYARTNYKEGFAEAFAMYMYDRQLLHPAVKQAVERVLGVKVTEQVLEEKAKAGKKHGK